MNILGVTHPMSWNNAACLVAGGRLVACAEEERLIRVKFAHGVAPERSIAAVCALGGVPLDAVDVIAVGWDLELAQTRKERLVWEFLQKGLPLRADDTRVRGVRHHLAHALSTYYASGFERAAIVTLDGSGEREAGVLAAGEGDDVKVLRTVPASGSFGYLYGKVTEALGFTAHADEGKVMGLAAYGTPRPGLFDFVDGSADPPQVNKRRLRRFLEGLKVRAPEDPLTDAHRDLAATLQAAYAEALIASVKAAVALAGSRDVCLAGGCALNCAANGALLRSGACDRLFVQPAAHDAGTAIGAAFAAFHEAVGVRPEATFTHAYYGPDVDPAEAERVARDSRLPASRPADLPATVSALLANGRIVGWCRGRAEIGPRALGARSILADPREATMKDRLNTLKGRESWRPYGPTILAEAAGEWIEGSVPSPFMLVAFQATARAKAQMPAAVHVDGTVRPQTLVRDVNPVLYDTIEKFRVRTGVPAVLNTSFNRAGEPIVSSARDAMGTFVASGLDALVIGDWLVTKEPLGR